MNDPLELEKTARAAGIMGGLSAVILIVVALIIILA